MGVIVKSRPQVLQAIVGTAGHVDHGKTSLVRLLTGCETDRLPEEKARGMSIDLGFAPCLLEGRRVVGIVDVPGHKDFIRNMVAGASSIDVLLLVVAADDGVMPQTIEHVKILRLLRAPQVIVALTKIDMVEPDMLELARQDVASFMARAGFAEAPIIPVCNMDGEGLTETRDAIDAAVERVVGRSADCRAFRMNVERVFSVKGYGTVGTGIPMSGQVAVGEKLQLWPSGQEVVVRTIQVYKTDSELAPAHCCCAINLRDVEAEQLERGMTLAWPGVYHATDQIIATLDNASDDHVLKRISTVMLHAGTGAVEASVKLLDAEELLPGESAVAHLSIEKPMVLAATDRFLIRQLSPSDTIGGGLVLSASEQRIRRFKDQIPPRFAQARDAGMAGDPLAAEVLAGADAILPAGEVLRATQCHPAQAPAAVARAVEAGILVDLGSHFAVVRRAGELIESVEHALARYHEANPYTWGMTPAHACENVGVDAKHFSKLAKLLTATGVLVVKHGRLALATFQPALSNRLLTLREQLIAAITAAGINAPARGTLVKELGMAEGEMNTLQKLLVEDGTIVVLDGNFMARATFEECRKKLMDLFASQPTVDLATWREALGSNRKMAVAMLDAFDAAGITRRVGETRVLVPHAPPRTEGGRP